MNQDTSRRDFIKISASTIGLSALTLVYPSVSVAGSSSMSKVQQVVGALSKALRLIGSTACMTAADTLEATHAQRKQVSLHLRDTDLTPPDVLILANAISSLPTTTSEVLSSVSLSYNSELRDAGAITFIQSLPPTVREVGMVGCRIGDAGGEAIYQWTKNATKLQMICIEDNALSAGMKLKFTQLARNSRALMIV